MARIHTISDFQVYQYTLALYCLSCNRWGEANLDRLIQMGQGDKLAPEVQFRCRDCGEIVEKQVRPPVPSLGSAVAYISAARLS